MVEGMIELMGKDHKVVFWLSALVWVVAFIGCFGIELLIKQNRLRKAKKKTEEAEEAKKIGFMEESEIYEEIFLLKKQMGDIDSFNVDYFGLSAVSVPLSYSIFTAIVFDKKSELFSKATSEAGKGNLETLDGISEMVANIVMSMGSTLLFLLLIIWSCLAIHKMFKDDRRKEARNRIYLLEYELQKRSLIGE